MARAIAWTPDDAELALRAVLNVDPGQTLNMVDDFKHVANCAAATTVEIDGVRWRVMVWPDGMFSGQPGDP